jgi:outer membrane immunogenic protein
MSSVKALKLAVAVAALIATGSAAQAQDKAALWEGAYAGVHIGADSGKYSVGGLSGDKIGGLAGGVHGGYNWQAGSMVYGLEGDADFSGAKKTESYTSGGAAATASLSNSFLGSLRGRVGIASGPALFYATGGVGFSTNKLEASATLAGVGTGKFSASSTKSGYVLGLGMDYALSSSLSARIEGLHYGFSDVLASSSGVKYDVNAIRAGLSYKF